MANTVTISTTLFTGSFDFSIEQLKAAKDFDTFNRHYAKTSFLIMLLSDSDFPKDKLEDMKNQFSKACDAFFSR